ncbi:MAG: hypothetical protein ACOCRX_01550 [Candidatus Woesearchaeota archaeon]
MNKKIKTGITILIILVISIVTFLSVPKLKESYIKNKIEKANYCEVDSDCVYIDSKCPFGCHIYVNEKESKEISNLIESYESKCVYGCISCEDVICQDNKCQEVCN